jgi:leader peptidase (prepilin peptidase)/N-methyltransferase
VVRTASAFTPVTHDVVSAVAFGLGGLAFGTLLVRHERRLPGGPAVPALIAGLSAGISLVYPDAYVVVLVAAFTGVILAAGFVDLRHRVIPNALLYPALVGAALAVVVGAAAGRDVRLVDAAVGLAAYGGGMLALVLVAPSAMGMGDAKLAALIGLVLGSQGLAVVGAAAFLGILLGGIGAAVALVRGASRKTAIPYGPYLAAGAIAVAFLARRLS